ncbi:hypothetical protein LZ198_18040 [Myxococcus sp. K15C18031901]|uniref:hypothetical protein n=1 Tax=Myxococcus dinghuensis TaxID=2906761 RepID=UPI0020A7A619|nr:hypothetical protein [Myxococcus dinghuensis]MCP3100774.1 hypothetical protein [Myxococcus dinghuensis]
MTTPILDGIRFLERQFVVTTVVGSGMFDPVEHGLKPAPFATSGHRGFVRDFSITEGRLFLETLLIGDRATHLRLRYGRARPLLGVHPRLVESFGLQVQYDDLHWPVPFTGAMRIGVGYLHRHVLDFEHPAPLWPYAEAHELRFEEGALIEAADRTEALARAGSELLPHGCARQQARETRARLARVFPWTTT